MVAREDSAGRKPPPEAIVLDVDVAVDVDVDPLACSQGGVNWEILPVSVARYLLLGQWVYLRV